MAITSSIRSIKRLNTALAVVLVLLGISTTIYAQSKKTSLELDRLETDFTKLSARFYSQHNVASESRPDTFEQLLDQFNKLEGQNRLIERMSLLYQNQDLIFDSVDDAGLLDISSFLLKQEDRVVADLILEKVQDQNEDALIAAYHYIWAQYHARRHEWHKVDQLLKNSIGDLSGEQSELAHLLYGSALQHLKKHRAAVEQYSKIPPQSSHYIYAQLNTAIASIRQGWIADAQGKIQSVLQQSKQGNDPELTHRLYLILGYALLQKEYYRDARDTFRKIKLDSRYASRALLGIGLTATSQGDYVGGLNALEVLQQKTSYDLALDESFLIIPHVYEKLQQTQALGDQYSAAIAFYQQRLIQLDQVLATHPNLKRIQIEHNSSELQIADNRFDIKKQNLHAFFLQFKRLEIIQTENKSVALTQPIIKLIDRYQDVLQRIVRQIIDKRKQYLNSYLSQSRYGLARYFDSQAEE